MESITATGLWSEAETDYLRQHYPTEGAQAVATALGRSLYGVTNRVRKIGLKRSLPPKWAGKAIEGKTDLEVAQMVMARQNQGLTLLAISEEWGVSRWELWVICKNCDVKLRDASDDMLRRWQVAPEETKQRMLSAAHNGARRAWADPEVRSLRAQAVIDRRTPEVLAARQAHHREMDRQRRERNRLSIRIWKRAYRREKPELHRVWDHNKRMKRIARPGTFTEGDVALQYEQQNGKCYWCQKLLKGVYHVDHIIALARGGTNWPNNLCCACPNCNNRKYTKMPWEFAGRLF